MTLLNAACEAAEANWKAKAIEAERGRIAAVDRLDRAREALCQIANGIPGPCLHATEALQDIAVEKRSPLESKGMAAGADSNQLKPRDRQ
jgi:hypothetical protein